MSAIDNGTAATGAGPNFLTEWVIEPGEALWEFAFHFAYGALLWFPLLLLLLGLLVLVGAGQDAKRTPTPLPPGDLLTERLRESAVRNPRHPFTGEPATWTAEQRRNRERKLRIAPEESDDE